jgi:hypothetical protein
MRVWLKEWSPLLAALLVVLSVIYTGQTLRSHTESMERRLTAIEKHIDAINNAIEGNQGVIVRIATLDLRVSDQLQSLITHRDQILEQDEQASINIRDEFQSLKNNVDTLLNITKRIEYLEEMLLDMQASIEEIKKQHNKERQ